VYILHSIKESRSSVILTLMIILRYSLNVLNEKSTIPKVYFMKCNLLMTGLIETCT
jgi:hypothetical protein